jgi:hypothetical protein
MVTPISTESWRFNTWVRDQPSPLGAGDGRAGHPPVGRRPFRSVNRPGRLVLPWKDAEGEPGMEVSGA